MPRIAKARRVCMEPVHRIFTGDKAEAENIVLCVEELESLRLMDFEDLSQDMAAERMSVSRGTFQRILYSARHKVAEALLTGKSIVIEGGNYEVSHQHCEAKKRCRCCRFSEKNNQD